MGLFITQSCRQDWEKPPPQLSLLPLPTPATPSQASGMRSVVKHVRESEKRGPGRQRWQPCQIHMEVITGPGSLGWGSNVQNDSLNH